MKKFEIIDREMVLNSRWMPIEKQTVRLPDGSLREWFINRNGNVVIVVPSLPDGSVLLQKAYKHGAGEVVYEFCAGMVDDGETPEQSAERELLEETGLCCESLLPIGETYSNPTGSQVKYRFFLAQNCRKLREPELEAAEQIQNFVVTDLAAAEKFLLETNGLSSTACIAALTFARAALKKTV